MSRRWAILFGTLLVLGGFCFGCWWVLRHRPRFDDTFDIGGGRTLRVWSESDPDWVEIATLMVYYRVDAGPWNLVHTTFLDHDDKGEYAFRVALADGGRLACVYEATRAAGNHHLLLMYDCVSGESWRRLRDDETGGRAVEARWRERHRRIKAEHPELPSPRPFDE